MSQKIKSVFLAGLPGRATLTRFFGRKPEIAKRVKVVLPGLPAIVIATFLVVAIIYGWTEPSSAPPSGNVSAPLNVSSIAQSKAGSLAIGTGGIGLFETLHTTLLSTIDGNVGIGTASPGAKLEVAGNIKIADGTQGAGKVLTSDASGLASWQTTGGGGVPSGAVMFFNLTSCPVGWTELTSARGRYIVGLPSGGILAGTVGTALTNLENRPVGQHAHGITLNWGNWYSCPFRPSGVNYCYSTTGGGTDNAGSVADTNAPYIQLLTCQKN